MFDQDLWEQQNGYHGMQVGCAAALGDWQFERERAAGEKLIKKLRAAKWAKDHPEETRAHKREWARKNPLDEEAKAAKNAKRRKATAKKRAAVGQPACEECGSPCKTAQVRMVGNSVCPPLAAALVRAQFAEQQASRGVA